MEEIILSVGIASYNRKKWLCKNVDNLLQYKGNDIEFIVCDNASDDGTWEALEQYNDRRLKKVRNAFNYGAVYNWNKSLLLGHGKYGVSINDRDTMDIGLLEGFVDVLRKSEEDVIVANPGLISYGSRLNDLEVRCCLMIRQTHPGSYFYKRPLIDKLRHKFEMAPDRTMVDDEELFARWETEIQCEYRLVGFYAESWKCYGKWLMILTDRGKNGIKQTRKEKTPWFVPQARIEEIKDIMHYIAGHGRDSGMEGKVLGGAYRGSMWIIMEVYAHSGENKPVKTGGVLAADFYRRTIKELKKEAYFTRLLHWKICKITLDEFARCKCQQYYHKLIQWGSPYWQKLKMILKNKKDISMHTF